MPPPAAICPSFRCESGATLLGIIDADGRVAYAPERLVVDDQFVSIAREGRAPERRFRFAGGCVEGACAQWKGDQCGVIKRVLTTIGAEPARELPACSVRAECRWYSQEGSGACFVCPLVITELRAEPTDGSRTEGECAR